MVSQVRDGDGDNQSKECDLDNRARKYRRTLQNKVRIKVFLEQLTLFINTFVALKQCINQ